jgi:hypothetical protein
MVVGGGSGTGTRQPQSLHNISIASSIARFRIKKHIGRRVMGHVDWRPARRSLAIQVSIAAQSYVIPESELMTGVVIKV